MKTKLSILFIALVSVLALYLAWAQMTRGPRVLRPATPTGAELQGQPWLIKYYGKTLGSIGTIERIRIRDLPPVTPSQMSTDSPYSNVRKAIEKTFIYDDTTANFFLGTPEFTIDYVDGMQAVVYWLGAIIKLHNGRQGIVYLSPPVKLH